MAKLNLALYWASACGGCDVAVLDLNERILKVAELADILLWPVALDYKYDHVRAFPDKHVDVCLFNGAIRNEENAELAHLLRRKSKVMVAFGTCAHLGGIPGLANFYTREDLFQQAYSTTVTTVNPDNTRPQVRTNVEVGELHLPKIYESLMPLDRVVPVDYYVPGCPPAAEQIWKVIGAIVEGKLPPPGSIVGAGEKALCEECPRTKGEKRIKKFQSVAHFIPDKETCLLEQGVVCCGPGTRSGCGARCVTANMPCRGCYGPAPGVTDQGCKMLSAVASVIDSEDPAEVERIVNEIEDPAGIFYRFSLPASLLAGSNHKETA